MKNQRGFEKLIFKIGHRDEYRPNEISKASWSENKDEAFRNLTCLCKFYLDFDFQAIARNR